MLPQNILTFFDPYVIPNIYFREIEGPSLWFYIIWKYESPVLFYFHNSVWKYVVPYADS